MTVVMYAADHRRDDRRYETERVKIWKFIKYMYDVLAICKQ